MRPIKVAEITGAAMADSIPVANKLEKMGLELRPASRQNGLYKYRLAPVGEKLILAHFNTLDEVAKYLKELSTAITTEGDITMT